MESTLKIVFELPNNKKLTVSLAAPASDIKRSEVEALANDMVAKKFLVAKDGSTPVGVKELYVHSVEDKALA